MKAINTTILTASALSLALTGCTGMRLSNSNALADDLYYDGTAVTPTAPQADRTQVISSADVNSYNNRVATYSSNRTNTDGRDFSQIQQYYSNASTTNGALPDTIANTAIAVNTEADGYWLEGFDGTEADQTYAERILRFHRPTVTLTYYSPIFTYARHSGDWNIYVDNYGSAYLVPTWSNPWYDNFYYGWGYGFHGYLGWGGWGFNYGWNRPWGWHSHWGWHHHYGWDYAWNGWGWYSPYYYHNHYYHPYGGPHHDFWHPRTYASRFSTQPQSYSTRQRESVTTNPNSSRAAQRYQQNLTSRSYTRTVDGNSTRTAASTGNSRRSASSTQSSISTSNQRSSTSTNTTVGNARRSSSNSTITGNSRSSSTYTPSTGNSRTSNRTVGTGNSRNSSSRSSSSYTPSRGSSSSYSSSNSRSSSSSRSYSSSGSSRSSSSYSGGSSSRSSSGGFSSGGGRSGSSSSSSHSSGGGRSR